jgi:Ribosomal protein L4
MISSSIAQRFTSHAIRGRKGIIPLRQRLDGLQISTSASSTGTSSVRRQQRGGGELQHHGMLLGGVQTFSTRSQPITLNDETVLYIPPNLKIDPRTSISPFAGLQTISPNPIGSEMDDSDNVPTANNLEHSEQIDGENDHDDDEEEAEAAGVYYSLSNKPEPVYAIPLPLRLNVPIVDFVSSSEAGTIHLSPNIFGKDPIRTDILHRCVIYQRNKKRGRRNGGAKTKTIGEVSGSGKKMRNQKGGGVARAGHKRPAHWRGGAKAHGSQGKCAKLRDQVE